MVLNTEAHLIDMYLVVDPDVGTKYSLERGLLCGIHATLV